MMFDHSVCENCITWSRNKNSCPYRNMSLFQYLDYKMIPYEIKEGGAKVVIDTSNLMNSSAMIELNREIQRSRNTVVESGWDYKVII